MRTPDVYVRASDEPLERLDMTIHNAGARENLKRNVGGPPASAAGWSKCLSPQLCAIGAAPPYTL